MRQFCLADDADGDSSPLTICPGTFFYILYIPANVKMSISPGWSATICHAPRNRAYSEQSGSRPGYNLRVLEETFQARTCTGVW